MEFKKGDKTIRVPGWVIATIAATAGAIATDICNVIGGKKK